MHTIYYLLFMIGFKFLFCRPENLFLKYTHAHVRAHTCGMNLDIVNKCTYARSAPPSHFLVIYRIEKLPSCVVHRALPFPSSMPHMYFSLTEAELTEHIDNIKTSLNDSSKSVWTCSLKRKL